MANEDEPGSVIGRELRRRNAIETGIGDINIDGRLDCKYLLGHTENVVLPAGGYNLLISKIMGEEIPAGTCLSQCVPPVAFSA